MNEKQNNDHAPADDQVRGASTRLAAAMAIADVLGGEGSSLGVALDRRTANLVDPRDRALACEMAYGVLRILPRLRSYAADLMDRSAKLRDLGVECLLLVGLYQLDALRVPDHAAVSQTVAAAKRLGKPWAAGFINAVLRNFQRHRKAGTLPKISTPPAQHCFPEWLAERLYQSWPDDAEQLMHQSNLYPPMTLRVNLQRLTRVEYVQRLTTVGLTARPLPYAPASLVLDSPVDVDALPGFDQGLVSVQDGAAQLAASLLVIPAEAQVLDACAAPGGKTAHLLETQSNIKVTAVDVDPIRISALRLGLKRLGLHARILIADLTLNLKNLDTLPPWADRLYDRILLDAPCSATGVIRRHPDIKWLRRPDDIAPLVTTQGLLLDRLWLQLRPGGVLLYVTCSLLAEENHELIQAFMQRTPDACELPIDVEWGRACQIGRQILTGEVKMDGFYFARLIRSVTTTSQ